MTVEEKTEWLKSPVSEKGRNLQPFSMLELRPFGGSRKKVKLWKTSVTIGSAETCELRLDDPFVSPQHARLQLGNHGYQVFDHDSRNGVILNGVRVESAPLPAQGVLRIGRSSIAWSKEVIDTEDWGEGCIVADPSMRELLEGLKRVARSSLPVLFLGETGTGKDVLARLLHRWSSFSGGPFVPVNGALTGGTLADSELFGHERGSFTGAESLRLGALRSAQHGTLFLDEIADVPEGTQVKLLRALESGEVKSLGADRAHKVEFRLVCATSRNMEQRVESGQFRSDLYFRIAGYVIHVPPLRERPKDILAIASKIAAEASCHLGESARAKLLSHHWPGNVRELKSWMKRAILRAEEWGRENIEAGDFSGMVLPIHHSKESKVVALAELEKRAILESLERNQWSRKLTCTDLKISRSTLYGKMNRHGIAESIRPRDSE